MCLGALKNNTHAKPESKYRKSTMTVKTLLRTLISSILICTIKWVPLNSTFEPSSVIELLVQE